MGRRHVNFGGIGANASNNANISVNGDIISINGGDNANINAIITNSTSINGDNPK